MATEKVKPLLVDRFCEPDLVFHSELRRHENSRCGRYRKVTQMSEAVQYMKDLKTEYPDLIDELWSVAPTAWYRVYRLRNSDLKATVLKIILDYLRTGKCPIELPPRDARFTLITDDIEEIIRYARGKPVTGKYDRHIPLYPRDVVLINQVFTAYLQTCDPEYRKEVADLEDKIIGTRGKTILRRHDEKMIAEHRNMR